jgi:hypothetical protein
MNSRNPLLKNEQKINMNPMPRLARTFLFVSGFLCSSDNAMDSARARMMKAGMALRIMLVLSDIKNVFSNLLSKSSPLKLISAAVTIVVALIALKQN